ncbi:hypothetical protein Lal_00027020 [Lupinus albus]|nr:hypothetical protein Lal_00027020 [Lupinus albus]
MATGSEVVGSNNAPSVKKGVRAENPTLRVFEFPNLDASPTIKEFEVLLDIGRAGRLKVYQFTDHQNITTDLIEELIRVRPAQSDIIKQGDSYGLKAFFLKKHLKKMVEQKQWDLFKPAFALAIYGLVLFPSLSDMVD